MLISFHLADKIQSKLPDIYNDPTQIGSENNWKKVVVGTYGNSYVIKKDGSLWACGLNDLGQLGIGSNTNVFAFTEVSCPSSTANKNIKSIDSEITIYPNPVHNLLRIDLGQSNTELIDISICDLNGKSIYYEVIKKQVNTKNQQMSIDLTSLNSGLCYIKVNSNKGILIHKIIKN